MRRQTRLMVSLGLPGALVASALAAPQTTTTTVQQIPKDQALARRAILKRKVQTPPDAGKGNPAAPPAVPVPPPPPPAPPPVPAPAPLRVPFEIELMIDGRQVMPAVMNRQDQLAQLTERFRPYLRLEYHFLRLVCAPTQEQRTRIARDVEREYKDAVARYHEIQRSPQFRRPGETPRVLPDPRKLIVEGLARAADADLTPEQADRYRQEIKQRDDDRKRVVIQNVVSRLDQALIFSSEQRAQLTERLGSAWDDAWFPTEFMMANSERYLSRVPNTLIVPLLNEDQIKVWNLTFFLKQAATGIVQAFPAINDDFPEDDELTKAREAEAIDAELTP